MHTLSLGRLAAGYVVAGLLAMDLCVAVEAPGKHEIGPVAAGGFYLEHGLPDPYAYYAFGDGDLSLTVERWGGINSIEALDIFSHDGKLYPDRGRTPALLRKEGGLCGKRELYGPGLQFISTHQLPNGRRGRNLYHFPETMELYPFGFRSQAEQFGHRLGYDLCIDGRSILFRLSNDTPGRKQLVVAINKEHIVSGECYSFKNQIPTYVDLKGTSGFLPPDFDPRKPFPDPTRKMTLTWDFIGYDASLHAFVMEGRMVFAYGTKPVAAVLAASRPMSLENTAGKYLLQIPWEESAANDAIRLCWALAPDRTAAHARAVQANERFEEIMQGRIDAAIAYASQSPQMEIEQLPAAAEFARTMPAFLRNMVLAETDKNACLRSAIQKYGYFADWDQIYGAKGFARLGDYATAKKLLRYMAFIPQSDGDLSNTPHIMIAIEDYLACSGDRAFLEEAYPLLKRYFLWAHRFAEKKTGMVPYPCSTGVDDPSEVGIKGLVWPSCYSGWWYDACRAMENFAYRLGDEEIQSLARTWGQKIAANYMPVFFDPKVGYLHAVVDPASRRGPGVYQNVSTIGMDYPYGDYLFRKHVREIAEYQAYQLYHPADRTAVSYCDKASEMWKNCIMRQHMAHEAKTARAAGLGDEAIRIVKCYLDVFERSKTAIETHNVSGPFGDESQRSNWQAFAARAAYEALIDGVIGIQCDPGGFQYVPCDMKDRMTLRNYRFLNSRWNVAISGKGPFVEKFAVDGVSLHGTLRLPIELLEDGRSHRLEIVRSAAAPSGPVLFSAVGASVTGIQLDSRTLSFTVRDKVHTSVKVFSPKRPSAQVGGHPVDVEWDEQSKIGWCDVVVSPGEQIRFKL